MSSFDEDESLAEDQSLIFTIGEVTQPVEAMDHSGADTLVGVEQEKSQQELKSLVAEQKSTICGLQKEVSSATLQMERVTQDYLESKRKHEVEIAVKDEEISKLKDTVNEYKLRVSSFEQTSSREKDKLRDTIKQLEEELKSKEEELRSKEEEMKSKEEKHKREKEELEHKITKKKLKIAKLDYKVERLQRELAEARQTIAEDSRKRAEDDKKRAEDGRQRAEEENAQMKQELERKNSSIVILTKRLNSMNSTASSSSDL